MGCDNNASPTQDGATTRILFMGSSWVRVNPVRRKRAGAVKDESLVRRFYGAAHHVARPAVRTQGHAVVADRQENARMRIPQRLCRQRAMQRQIRRRDLDVLEGAGVSRGRLHGASDVVQPMTILLGSAV